MTLWWNVAMLVVSLAISYLTRPRPARMPDQRPPGIGTVTAPTADPGREIPVIFGTRWITGPNVVWYGDLRTEPIEEIIDLQGKK